MTAGAVRLDSRPEMPIVCAGSPYEIGHAQGQAAVERVRSASTVLRELDAFRSAKPSLLPFGVFQWLAERRARALWSGQLTAAASSMDARVRGIAVGAGVKLATLQLLNVLEPLMADLGDQVDVPPLGGCSAIAVTGSRAADGEPVIARNFDYLPSVQPLYLMRDTRPATGMRSLDFTTAPLAGTVDGLNEAGLCIVDDYAFVRDAPAYGRTITMAISEALACCTTVSEAADFLMRGPRWGGGILMLADADGDIASLELSNGRASLRRPVDGDGVLFHTNRFGAPEMREVEIAEDAHYTGRAPAALRGRAVHESSTLRDQRFAELIEACDRISADDLQRIMADHGRSGCASHATPCVHSDYWFTSATLQFFPASRRVRVAFDSACRARFVELSFDADPRVIDQG